MFLRIIICLLFITSSLAQNNLIVFSSSPYKFNLKCSEITLSDTLQQEIKMEGILKDTLNLSFNLESNKGSLKRAVILEEKGKSVKNKEFIYSLEFNEESKKLKLVFITVNDIIALPNPLLPPKPKEDTTYKWRNNVYGNLFEIKEGKISFFYNVPKDGNCTTPMPDDNVGHLTKLILRNQINTEKYNYAREAIKNNCFSCKQLAQILPVLPFELDKLKLIKEAYPNLTDKNNLKTLEESFKFESSKKEFRDIAANPNNLIVKNKVNCNIEEKDSVIHALVSDIRLFTNDYERYQYVKEKAAKYCFNTNQFKSVLAVFVHDREKLDLTKQFYNNITDKEKLSAIKDVFSYQESYSNLLDYLKQTN